MNDSVLEWISRETFLSKISPVDFDRSLQVVSGLITKLDRSVFDVLHERINEGQYLNDAWRWYGIANGTPFSLDVAKNDYRGVKPFSFYIQSQYSLPPYWLKIQQMDVLISQLGSVQIDRIAASIEKPEFLLIRDHGVGDSSATTIYRYNNIDEGVCLGKYLNKRFQYEGLYIATLIAAENRGVRGNNNSPVEFG